MILFPRDKLSACHPEDNSSKTKMALRCIFFFDHMSIIIRAFAF